MGRVMGVFCVGGPLDGREVSPECGPRWPYVHPLPFVGQPYETWRIGHYVLVDRSQHTDRWPAWYVWEPPA